MEIKDYSTIISIIKDRNFITLFHLLDISIKKSQDTISRDFFYIPLKKRVKKELEKTIINHVLAIQRQYRLYMITNKTRSQIHKSKIKISNRIDKLYKINTVYNHESTLLSIETPEYIEYRRISNIIRQIDMKDGKLSQIMIGNFIGWTDLGEGHPSGLDCMKNDNSIIMEVKNKYNTCNSGSRKSVYDKLSVYKKSNPNTRCVLGIINPKCQNRNLSRIINHNGSEIEIIQGSDLTRLVFTIGNINYTKEIVDFVMKQKKLYYSLI